MKASRWVQPAIAAFFVLVFLVAGMGAVSAANKVDALTGALLTDPIFKVRTHAALLLGKLGDKDAIDSLVKALGDDNKTVRAMAAQSLGKLGGDKATVALKSLLQRESDPFARGQAEKALATLTAVQAPLRFGVPDIRQDWVSSFREKFSCDAGLINGGFFVLEPRALDFIKDDATRWEEQPLETLAQRGKLAAYKHRGFWYAMDTLRDKNHLEELWAVGKAPWKIWP